MIFSYSFHNSWCPHIKLCIIALKNLLLYGGWVGGGSVLRHRYSYCFPCILSQFQCLFSRFHGQDLTKTWRNRDFRFVRLTVAWPGRGFWRYSLPRTSCLSARPWRRRLGTRGRRSNPRSLLGSQGHQTRRRTFSFSLSKNIGNARFAENCV